MSGPGRASEVLLILGDGDRVRLQLEKRLLAGTLEEVSTFSAALTAGVSSLAADARAQLGAVVIMAGGDDVLLEVKSEAFSVATLETLSKKFLQATGCSISFGVGPDVERAYLCLRKAKASGGGVIVVAETTS
jgi:hypothetical protein